MLTSDKERRSTRLLHSKAICLCSSWSGDLDLHLLQGAEKLEDHSSVSSGAAVAAFHQTHGLLVEWLGSVCLLYVSRRGGGTPSLKLPYLFPYHLSQHDQTASSPL